MFLDLFVEDTTSESIDLVDLQLECAVSLEAAYNDMMFETCQLKYQELTEGASVINEGVVDTIKNFFKKIINAIKKFFGASSGSVSSQDFDKLKKQLGSDRIAAGIRYMVKHPEVGNKYNLRLINVDKTIFIGGADLDSAVSSAADSALDKMFNEPNPNGDELAEYALHIFIKNAFNGNYQNVFERVKTLSDYKKAINDQISYKTVSEVYSGNYVKSDRDLEMWIDKIKLKCVSSYNYGKSMERQMQTLQNNILKQIEGREKYEVPACKIVNTLTQACMGTISYGCKLNNELYNEYRRLFNIAKNIQAKDD